MTPPQIAVSEADREAAAALIQLAPLVDNADVILHGGADDSAFVQAFARRALTATVEARKELIAQGCIHAAKAGERGEERADIKAWQESQREFFNRTICEIVSEYAEWRDAQAPDPRTAATTLRNAGLLKDADFNRIIQRIEARDRFREVMS